MPLPVMTVPDDALRIVGFMKRSPGGVSIDSVKATVGEKLVDGRKVAAYVAWGFIEKAGDELQLTEFGRALARADAEEHSKFFARVITRVATYAALVTLYARTNRNALSSNPRGVTAWIDFGIKTWI